jgi:hypothetical protein
MSAEYIDTIGYPISKLPQISLESMAKKTDILQIVLNQIPIPDDSTPWEAILEFKKDHQSILKLKALKNWITDISKSHYTITEVIEKTDFLLEQYTECLRLHKLKSKVGLFQTIVISSGTFLENIAHLRFSEIAKFPFSFADKKIELLSYELGAPGHEIAYIYSTIEKFKK